eukprot:783171-Pelagomonas_calceolata.AAC.3
MKEKKCLRQPKGCVNQGNFPRLASLQGSHQRALELNLDTAGLDRIRLQRETFSQTQSGCSADQPVAGPRQPTATRI